MERKRITIEELLDRYAAGERDFSEVRISYDTREGEFGPAIRDFDGINLSGANFRGSTFETISSYLAGINLSGCDLRYANLSNGT